MAIANRTEPALLLLGDVVFFYLALWVTLLIRYAQIPDTGSLYNHAVPFSFLFAVWVTVFFIAGLYDKHTTLFRKKLPDTILNTQVVNISLAALFFFIIPYFGITPKTNLVIYLAVSFGLILLWRLKIVSLLHPRQRESAVLVASGSEAEELKGEVNANSRYRLAIAATIDPASTAFGVGGDGLVRSLSEQDVTAVVLDMRDTAVAARVSEALAEVSGGEVEMLDFVEVYEEVFDRTPLSALAHGGIADGGSSVARISYDIVKRIADVLVAALLGTLSLALYPFIVAAIRLDDGGRAFIVQTRVGQGHRSIRLHKFRSMQWSEDGVWVGESKNRVTRVGAFLRATRLDELPQLWDVVAGKLSLIGPRPDIAGLGERLRREIPGYGVRYLVKPGLSGWAQIKQTVVPQSVAETKVRLSYDLYYVKNRSLILDLAIALRTVKTLLSKSGA